MAVNLGESTYQINRNVDTRGRRLRRIFCPRNHDDAALYRRTRLEIELTNTFGEIRKCLVLPVEISKERIASAYFPPSMAAKKSRAVFLACVSSSADGAQPGIESDVMFTTLGEPPGGLDLSVCGQMLPKQGWSRPNGGSVTNP